MNPFTWLYRRSRAFRVLCYFLIVLVTFFIWAMADNQYAHYTEVGDLTVFTAFMLFAAWAWWYGEDRDRRRAANAARDNGAGSSNGDGSSSTTA
jgi:uncharacterized membrane protein